MAEKILILGNGFNHALNLGVDYSDYFNSPNWKNIKRKYKYIPIIAFLSSEIEKRNYNIEELLEDYLENDASCSNAENDRKAFNSLERSFSQFVDSKIKTIDSENFVQSNKAFCIIKKYQEMRKNSNVNCAIFIYSFSYVRYDDIRKKFDISIYNDIVNGANDNYIGNPWGGTELDIAYNHGKSSKGKSKAILGLSLDAFRGRTNLISKYKFLLKELHKNYPIENKCYLINSLFEAKSINFFGFGFTKPDIPYVKDWLTSVPSFSEEREIVFNILKRDKNKIIETIQEISGCNWNEFKSHYRIIFNYEDNSEEEYNE